MNNIEKVNLMSPLTWAYVGDSVFELYVREHLVNTTDLKPHKLHLRAIQIVNAQAQAKILKKIFLELTKDEQEIVKRTRNTENHHIPKNANLTDYMYATAFEGLIGFLYLTRKKERLTKILELSIKNVDIES